MSTANRRTEIRFNAPGRGRAEDVEAAGTFADVTRAARALAAVRSGAEKVT